MPQRKRVKKKVPRRVRRKKKPRHHYRKRAPGLLELIHEELLRKLPPAGYKRMKFEPYRRPVARP